MTPPVDWLQLAMGLFGGLALFLAGLDMLSDGLKKAAGRTLGTALSRLTTNRFTGVLTGAVVTGVLNSSSVTTVLVVGFITAGLMTLSQAVGVIMGANIGSTVTAQIIAFNVSAYALLPVAIGFFLLFAGRRDRMRHAGMMIMGLGLVFYGMGVMSQGMAPLRTYPPFIAVLEGMERPLGGVLAGALFTALIQSSAATVGIAIALAAEGLLSLEGGILLALGANIGTCMTALLASLGKPVEARRAAVVHLTFNVLGVAIWLPLLPVLARLAVRLSPVSDAVEPAVRMAAEVPRQIANANTLFNVINTGLFIGFTGAFARAAERLVPARALPPQVLIAPAYLDDAALALPALALQRVRLELGRVGDIAGEMLADIGPALQTRDLARCEAIARRDDEIDVLEAALLAYLGRIRQQALTEAESREQEGLMTAIVHLERLADVVETNLVGLVRKAGEQPLPPDAIAPLVAELYGTVCGAVRRAVQAVRDADQHAAADVLALRATVDDQAHRLAEEQAGRLRGSEDTVLRLARLRLAAANDFQTIYDLARRLAQTVLPGAVPR